MVRSQTRSMRCGRAAVAVVAVSLAAIGCGSEDPGAMIEPGCLADPDALEMLEWDLKEKDYDCILGIPWFRQYNPVIVWTSKMIVELRPMQQHMSKARLELYDEDGDGVGMIRVSTSQARPRRQRSRAS